jgi:uncharacterized membrane protein
MKKTPKTTLLNYLRNHGVKNSLATGLVVIAGIGIASIGVVSLANILHNWFIPKTFADADEYGRAFNAMVADSIVSLIAILPSLPIFLIAYLISESHPIGSKLSIAFAIGLLAFAFLC